MTKWNGWCPKCENQILDIWSLTDNRTRNLICPHCRQLIDIVSIGHSMYGLGLPSETTRQVAKRTFEQHKGFEIHATKYNLRACAKNLPIDKIELHHLKIAQTKLFDAKVITIRINRQVKVLKDIHNSFKIGT